MDSYLMQHSDMVATGSRPSFPMYVHPRGAQSPAHIGSLLLSIFSCSVLLSCTWLELGGYAPSMPSILLHLGRDWAGLS